MMLLLKNIMSIKIHIRENITIGIFDKIKTGLDAMAVVGEITERFVPPIYDGPKRNYKSVE